MRLVFRPEALRELLEAQAWYEECAPGLGFEFARAVDATMAQILRMSLAHPPIDAQFRHALTRKFPYSIIYHVSASELIVVSCLQHRRKPDPWRKNLPG